MKKISFFALILTSSLTFAAGTDIIVSSAPIPMSFNGFYAGIGGGATFGDTTLQFTNFLNRPGRNNTFLTNKNSAFSNNGLGVAFIGYGHAFQSFYLGGEVGGSLSNGARTTTHSLAQQEVGFPTPFIVSNVSNMHLKDYEFTVDARPGFLVTASTLVYGRIGAAFNRINLNSASQFQFSTATSAKIALLPYNVSHSETGLRLGVGFEKMFTRHLSLRGDYIFTDYGKLNGRGIVPFPFLGPQVTFSNTTRLKLQTHTVLASLSYYFSDII
jgi:opacity protein-like surface antigen